MDKLLIRGGRPLNGSIAISGAKNAALPLMAASLLTDAPLRLRNLPRLADITTMGDLLNQLGVEVVIEPAQNGHSPYGRIMRLTAAQLTDPHAPYDMVRKMRASVLVLGPLLARSGQAVVSMPGGCAIGTRPIDLHLMGLEALGAELELTQGYVKASAPTGLKGTVIDFPKVSVGATENVLMAACLARGTTVLKNAAREPEIVDLGRCLNTMGAKISGLGTSELSIDGVNRLYGADYAVMPDRIETGTYAAAALITGGDVTLTQSDATQCTATLEALAAMGAHLETTAHTIRVASTNESLKPLDLTTAPYPGFATDMQAQIMALMCLARGRSVIHETIFENRFMHVAELARMGANIHVEGNHAHIEGVDYLVAAPVMATDLRASVSLVLAGLAARGETEINRLYHLDRGYERLEEKLTAAGAHIERVAA